MGEAEQFDDLTMLAIRYNGPSAGLTGEESDEKTVCDSISIQADIGNIDDILEWMDDLLISCGCDGEARTQLDICVDEIFGNIARYAYPDAAGDVSVTLRIDRDCGKIALIFEDSGIPYDPITSKTPDITLPAKDRKTGGFGIHLVKRYADQMRYEYTDGGALTVALMVCAQEDDRLIIDWMYTVPEHRGEGIGSELLMLAFEEASRRGLKEVAARISLEYENAGFGWKPEEFFVNDVFSDIEEGEAVWVGSVAEMDAVLRKDEKKNEAFSEMEGIKTPGEIPDSGMNDIIAALEEKFPDQTVLPVNNLVAAADPEVSVLRIEDTGCTGALLVMRGNRYWYPVALLPHDYEDSEEIIRAALYHLTDHAKTDDVIEIPIRRQATRKVVAETALPGREYEVCYYLAKINDYEEQKKIAEEYIN